MTTTGAPPELHLPDLPEVPVTLGHALPEGGRRLAAPFGQRLRDAVSTYLPLLLMAFLALGTWWLVRNTPSPEAPKPPAAVRSDPDYTMRDFSLTRFAPDGRSAVRLEGEVLRHFPDTDRFEIEGVRVRAVSADGRVTRARARRALANGDATEVQLFGEARVEADLRDGEQLEIEGEFLHVFVRSEQLRSHLPVLVRRGSTVTHAGGIDYNHLDQQLRLDGPVRASVAPSDRSVPDR